MGNYAEKLVFELEARGRDPKTIKGYLQTMDRFTKHFGKHPKDLGIPQIKEYMHYLLHEKKYAHNTVNSHLAALRFYYRNILFRYWYVDAIHQVKSPQKIPVILSEEEVAAMINNVNSVFYKAVFMLMYSSGLRQSEVRNIKTIDIDASRNIIDIRNAKGRVDRQGLLSPMAYDALRTYWRLYRLGKPKCDYIFVPTKNSLNGNLLKPLSHTAIGYMIKTGLKAANIKKKLRLIRLDIPLLFTC
jgi:integrase/recombinase XerD